MVTYRCCNEPVFEGWLFSQVCRDLELVICSIHGCTKMVQQSDVDVVTFYPVYLIYCEAIVEEIKWDGLG